MRTKLGVAEENSGRLVTLVRNQAGKIAGENEYPYVIVNGAGTGRPFVLQSLTYR